MTVLASELSNPLIIGLPHIVTSFLPILVSQLQKARKILLTPQPRVFMIENHELMKKFINDREKIRGKKTGQKKN